ncbi:hypothetical protein, variant 1 [Aphanomyces astaci]|uniref:Uncharacterized protein n=1 Tax=Aphanomyces astaci TaxID=112090 RepID=W4GM51_APHAT|nr:hypothetical protein, variant 1 [Aphanomyces astaci]ETV80451.1 hypothetical protein, variant 1 [Aphanomyces astaci]|eukprot:XP_009830375.1 hypothetical protein, variant 1 [Aphanomyces astaci]
MPIADLERDSVSSEDLSPEDLRRLVFPKDWTLYDRFACAVSQQAFRGWVKQPSPSCAAAALAGALNTVYGYARTLPEAYTTMDILSVYRTQFEDILARHRSEISTALGEACLASLEVAMQSGLQAQGLQYGGVGDHKVTKAVLRRCLRDCLPLLTSSDEVELEANMQETNDESSITPLNVEVVVIDDYEVDDDDSADGAAKLCRDDRPSTAVCGNVALLNAALYVHSTSVDTSGSRRIPRLGATCLMGKATTKCKLHIALSSTDSADKQTRDWKLLWSAFTDDHTALVVHLKNHYALLFALREWKDSSTQEWTRQLLTARRCQRPTAWIDWSELRQIFLAWVGYKVLSFVVTP